MSSTVGLVRKLFATLNTAEFLDQNPSARVIDYLHQLIDLAGIYKTVSSILVISFLQNFIYATNTYLIHY